MRMMKRDTITRIILNPVDDGSGGNSLGEPEVKEIVPAHVSSGATANEITMFGLKTQEVLHTTTDVKLDDRAIARYIWSDKIFRVSRQIKFGNEWLSTLIEVNE